MLCYFNLSESIFSCTCTKRTILEQNALLQGLTNVGITYVGLCGMFEYFVVVCGPLISIKSLLVLVTGFLTHMNSLCAFFFTS